MKKLLYSLAALAVLAGCAKETATKVSPCERTIDLTLRVDQSATTKTEFDGDAHINWLAGDAIAVMIDTKSGSQSHSGAYRYSEFKIGSDLQNPVFSGSMTYMDDQAQDKMWVYGFYPYSSCASATDCKIHGKNVILSGLQTFSQTSWDGKADIMAIEPVELAGTPGGSAGYYSWKSDLTVRFAHVFGFGCLSFAGLSEEIGAEPLTKVIITATNADAATHPLAGTFAVNLEDNVIYGDDAVKYSANANNTLSLTAASPVAIKDSKVWFVANPGTYDVTIQAITADHKITYIRSGLVVERAKITKPVLNLKAADVVSSTAVDITGKSWKHNPTAAYAASGNEMFFTNGKTTVNWGTLEGCELMEMNLNYVGAASGYYGTPQNKNGIYTQDFNYSAGRSLNGIKIQVASSSKFIGMKGMKVNAGLYNQSSSTTYTCDLKVFAVDGEGEHQIGNTCTVTGSTASREGTDFFFDAASFSEGKIIIEISNCSYNYAAPYLGEVEINPTPGITLDASSAAYLSGAAAGEFGCSVVMADSDPVVEADMDWIHPVYADGKVSYTVDANTSDDNRSGAITIKASNSNGESSASFTIQQLGAKYVEYTLDITYEDIKDALLAAGQAYIDSGKEIAASTYFTVNVTANATTAAVPGYKFPVELECQNILYKASTENQTISVYGGSTYGKVVSATPVYAITGFETKLATSGQTAPSVYVCKAKNSSTTAVTMNADAEDALKFSGSHPFTDPNPYFTVGASSWSYKYHDMSYIKVVFLAEAPEGYSPAGDTIGDGKGGYEW